MADEQGSASCCTPAADRPAAGSRQEAPAPPGHARHGRHRIEQCAIPAGTFHMGDQHGDGLPADGEQPVHERSVGAFHIDATSVTNADFAAFVDATDHRTDAETFGFSAVFHTVVAADDRDVLGRAPQAPWWLSVRGADWRHPEGRHSTCEDRLDHPVVHVSHDDARAYCAWAGRRLPTEAEWERACRGGVEGRRYPWGDRPRASDGSWRCNIWQGSFPHHNTEADGFVTTAPVRTYAPNGYGLWQTIGNVWEWCRDVFDPRAYADHVRGGPRRPAPGPAAPRVLRGGSYLCHDSYCNRYRNAARTGTTPDSSLGNAGFRTVADTSAT